MRCGRHSADGAGLRTAADSTVTRGSMAGPGSTRTSLPLPTPSLARAAGQAVAIVDGKIVENLHIVAARALIARVCAIAARAAQ